MNLVLRSGEMTQDKMQDMEEMVALIPEVLVSTHRWHVEAIQSFAEAVHVNKTDIFQRRDTQQVADRVINILREATEPSPDLQVSFALASCLSARFEIAHVINDYEEAMAIVDKILADTPGDDRPTIEETVTLTSELLTSRLSTYPRPEYLEDTIHRLRSLLCIPILSDLCRTGLTNMLDACTVHRFNYFGVTGNPRNPSPDSSLEPHTRFSVFMASDTEPPTQSLETYNYLNDIKITLQKDETTDVEVEAAVDKAVELSRTFLPLQQSSRQWAFMPAMAFCELLFRAYELTKRLDYLNKSITLNRDLLKVLTQLTDRFKAKQSLLYSLTVRFNQLRQGEDSEEAFQLYPLLVNDESGEIYDRFKISYEWATGARGRAHPSMSTAYEAAMSLMQETLHFSPTLQTQHFRLTRSRREMRELSSDYASYQIETNHVKQAIETLERGRGLLWSEMRGFRTSTDQLRTADPAFADKLADINRRLESVTMAVAHRESEEIQGDSGTGTGRGEGMDPIGRLVTTQRRLLQERETLISRIQSFPGLENFLKPPSFDDIRSVATHGPVIIINQSEWRSNIIILRKEFLPSVISTPSDFHDRANRLKDDLLRVRNDKKKGPNSKDYDLTLASVLADLYELVGKPVICRLRQLKVPEKSRVWLCPTNAFCSLPLHAMGPIPSDDCKERYFMDLFITSYTPTLSALIESRKPRSSMSDSPSLLLVAQPDTLPGAWGEIAVIQSIKTPVTSLISDMATPSTVVEQLRDHQFAHFVCHGLLETGKPFDASFELDGGNLTLLEIVRSHLPTAEFAFLSACHTAELTEDSVVDEGLHLAAAMQYCGFRSVVGTMWAMADVDGEYLSKHFYKTIFSNKDGPNGVPYSERSARALQLAVKKLRQKRKREANTLERWVNFVHYGA